MLKKVRNSLLRGLLLKGKLWYNATDEQRSVTRMLNLALAIVCSMLVTVIMRVSKKYVRNNLSMLAMNYVMCSVLGAMFAGGMELFPAQEGLGTALMMGTFNGALYLGGFVLLQWNIARNGVVLPATFMKLGVLVPTILALTVFKEQVQALQIVGIVMAIGAILLLKERGDGGAKHMPGLILLLLCGGFSEAMSKVYEEMGPAALKNQFLLYTFGMALVLCVILCIAKKQKISWMDALFGLIIAVPNYFSSRFLLLSLSDVPAVIAYPTCSVGTIVLVTAAGVVCFKEKLSKRKLLALGVILLALVLLNI